MKTVGTLGPLSPIQYPKAIETARDRVVEAAKDWASDYERSELLGHPMELAIFDAVEALTAQALEGSDGR